MSQHPSSTSTSSSSSSSRSSSAEDEELMLEGPSSGLVAAPRTHSNHLSTLSSNAPRPRASSYSGIWGSAKQRIEVLEEKVKKLEAEGRDQRRDLEAMQLQIRDGVPDPVERLHIPEPGTYAGERDSTAVGNFLFDMEQYFRAAKIKDEGTKVSIATMYLMGHAKLWWRTMYNEIQDAPYTWALLKAAIRKRFYPANADYNARLALRNLKHTGTIQEYSMAFSTHMLDIRRMSEDDKLFTFMEGLKPWVRTELQRQRVGDLTAAVVAAERLMDYNPEPPTKQTGK